MECMLHNKGLRILFTKLHCLKNDLNKYLEDTAMYERQYENLDSHIIINRSNTTNEH